MKTYATNYLKTFNEILSKSKFYKNSKEVGEEFCFDKIDYEIKKVFKSNSRIFFLGNGASAAFANHMALDFSKNGKVKSFSLSDSSLLTALSNDYNYEDVFMRFLEIYELHSDDLVITISSSGNSKNILNSLSYSEKIGSTSIALSGLNSDNSSIQLSNYSIFVPAKTYGMVECAHQLFLHLILDRYMSINEWEKKEAQNMDSKNFKL